MRDVDARVDDRHGLARSGRLHAVGADRGAPPLARDERVCGLLGRARLDEQPLGLCHDDGAGRSQPREGAGVNAPDVQLRHELAGPRPVCQIVAGAGLQLCQVRASGCSAREQDDRHDQQAPRQGSHSSRGSTLCGRGRRTAPRPR